MKDKVFYGFKVYCGQCHHFSDDGQQCWHKNNIYDIHSWREKEIGHHQQPFLINAFNDCQWWERRPVKPHNEEEIIAKQ